MRIKLHILFLFILLIIIEITISKGSNKQKLVTGEPTKQLYVKEKSSLSRNKRSPDKEEIPFWQSRGERISTSFNSYMKHKNDSENNENMSDSEKSIPFWGSRGKRNIFSLENYSDSRFPVLATDSKYFEPNCKQCYTPITKDQHLDHIKDDVNIPFWANHGQRNSAKVENDNVQSEPFWASRGKRQEDEEEDEPPFWASRGKRQNWSQDTVEDWPFWASRGRRDEGKPFGGSNSKTKNIQFYLENRDKHSESEPFWASRGRREEEEPFWASRGKKEEEEPFWASRGRREETEPFWASRGKKEEDEPFWASRGRREEEPFWASRGRRDKAELYWVSRGKKEEEEEPFWASRGKKEEEAPVWASRGKKEEEEPFWASRGKKEEEEPFWASRGKKEEPFWASRGRREKAEPYWASRSKKEEEDPFWASRGRREEAPPLGASQARGLIKNEKQENLKKILSDAINKVEDNIENIIRERRDHSGSNIYWNSRGRDSSFKNYFKGGRHRYQVPSFIRNMNPGRKQAEARTVLDDRIFAEQPHYIIVERSSRSSREEDPFFISRGKKKFINSNNMKPSRDRRGALEELVKSVRNDPYYIARGKKHTWNNISENSTLQHKQLSKAKELICATIEMIASKQNTSKTKREVNENDRDRRTILKKLAAQLQMDPYFVSRGKKNESDVSEYNIEKFINDVSDKCTSK